MEQSKISETRREEGGILKEEGKLTGRDDELRDMQKVATYQNDLSGYLILFNGLVRINT